LRASAASGAAPSSSTMVYSKVAMILWTVAGRYATIVNAFEGRLLRSREGSRE
jgi:hypothetical protein